MPTNEQWEEAIRISKEDEEARKITDLDDEYEAKAIIIREGASSRTAEELSRQFLEDASTLLPDAGWANIVYEDEYLDNVVNEAEMDLAGAEYTTFWNDGYVIYYGLSEEAIEALSKV